MKYFKVAIDNKLAPVEKIEDLISNDRRQLFYTIEENETTVSFPKPDNYNDIQSITIYKKGNKVDTKVRPAVAYKFKGIESQRYSSNHIKCLEESHNEAAVAKLYKKISCDGYLIHKDNTILRVRTTDNRVYVIFQGIVFALSQTLRLSRIFGHIPESTVEEIVEGEYEAKNLKFTFEKQAFPKRDLVFK